MAILLITDNFLSVSCLMKDERSGVWMFISGLCCCLHNSPRPLPIKGVWNGVLSLACGYTEHRGRFLCKAARVILCNQAVVNTLLWVILQKESRLNVNLPKSFHLVRTRTLPRWPKVNLLMALYKYREQINAGEVNAGPYRVQCPPAMMKVALEGQAAL